MKTEENILPSTRTIATTSSGKVFIRVSDNCFLVGQKAVYRMVENNVLITGGAKRNRTYELSKKNKNWIFKDAI